MQFVGNRFDVRLDRCSSDEVDGALLARVRDGDREALGVLFDKCGSALVNFVHRFLGSRARAEEIAQLAFVELFRTRRRHDGDARAATVLYRIATEFCLDSAVGRSRSGDRPTEDGDFVAAVSRAVASLPPHQRIALLLSRVDGFSAREVADCLGLSRDAAKTLIFRATVGLRESLRNAARLRNESSVLGFFADLRPSDRPADLPGESAE